MAAVRTVILDRLILFQQLDAAIDPLDHKACSLTVSVIA
jgi:hypothetical protein